MKVLLLNGSANKKGNTFTALSEIARQLEKNGVETEIMQLGNKPVRGCLRRFMPTAIPTILSVKSGRA